MAGAIGIDPGTPAAQAEMRSLYMQRYAPAVHELALMKSKEELPVISNQ
jgi:hypothetical protein